MLNTPAQPADVERSVQSNVSPMPDHRDTLLSPIKIGGRTCPNRFFVQALEGGDADSDGNPTAKTYERYEKLFRGESGLISLEAITVTDRHRSRLQQLVILPKNRDSLARLVAEIKAINPQALFIFQITHAGEISNPDFSTPVSVKPLFDPTVHVLSEEEVEAIIDEFVVSARIAHDIGADGIDIKLCHSYLPLQILRPYNDRKWKYGGSWENRRRFAFDLYERITRAINDDRFLIGSKISAWEGFPGGFGSIAPDSEIADLTEPLDLIKGLEDRGAHFIIQSAGGNYSGDLLQPDLKHLHNAYLHHSFAKTFRDTLRPSTVVIGSAYSAFAGGKVRRGFHPITESSLFSIASRNIRRGYVDMIGLGRQSFSDPLLPQKLREGRENEIKFCTTCDNCSDLLGKQGNTGCATYNRYYIDLFSQTRKPRQTANGAAK